VEYSQVIVIFTSILYEALPFVVLGVVLAGLLEEFVPQQLILKLIPKRKVLVVLAICLGGLLGMLFPMCECGIIPVMRRLLRKGVPLSVCICYMLAGPIINVVVILSTLAAFSGQEITLESGRSVPLNIIFTSLRVGLGYLVACVTSFIVEWQFRIHGTALLAPMAVRDTAAHEPLDFEGKVRRRSWATRIGNITETAIHDFIDIMAYLVLGAFIAAIARLALPAIKNAEQFIRSSPLIAIAVMMGLAVAFCLCSEADAFVAANFQPQGLWPLAAKLAFLTLGPMLDFKLYFMYTRVFKPRLIATIILCVVAQVFVYSVVVHYLSEQWINQTPTMTGDSTQVVQTGAQAN
jgi:uncharacterized membrane protein YraQ (UPF0718 family)